MKTLHIDSLAELPEAAEAVIEALGTRTAPGTCWPIGGGWAPARPH